MGRKPVAAWIKRGAAALLLMGLLAALAVWWMMRDLLLRARPEPWQLADAPLPGDIAMPRVQGPDFGASERMVVSPGHEADSIIHMPGGRSGHPLSPYWGAGHDDWVHGRPTPFLPGQPQHTLRLEPGAKLPSRKGPSFGA